MTHLLASTATYRLEVLGRFAVSTLPRSDVVICKLPSLLAGLWLVFFHVHSDFIWQGVDELLFNDHGRGIDFIGNQLMGIHL